ncbi:MAG TPA: MarR family transcriptional regulator [Kofleriaceae bacterium]|nr:MarR family transcriptional regulator [Kofleriaceae bacterium]
MPTLTPERTRLTGETLQFMKRMWDLAHALDVRSKRMARSLGVTGPQRLVIRVLGRAPESTASDISQTLGIHPSTLTGVLRRLELQGAIERRADDVDRRRLRFRLTRKGVAIDRERKGTVEAAVRRALTRAGGPTVQRTLEMFEILTAELTRRE